MRVKVPMLAGFLIVAVGLGAATAIVSAKRPNSSGESFLGRYVAKDGRVVRLDQGGDSVSEGQAYAMLLSVSAGREETFERIWNWTKRNLQRPDALLSWHWDSGKVVDPEPAADADLDAAYALLRAADRFGRPNYRSDALAIADAILERQTARVGDHFLLMAGPWAVPRGIVNPSYWWPSAFAALGRASGDQTWNELIDGAVWATRLLASSDPRRLPPDWAVVNGSNLRASGPPDEPRAPAMFGLEAPRTIARFAHSCRESTRRIAASANPDVSGDPHVVALVGAAASENAAGNESLAASLMRRAEAKTRRDPTYYGDAWFALGKVLIAESSECP